MELAQSLSETAQQAMKTRDSRMSMEDAPCISVKKNLTPEQWAA
jgi:hypothetical protein